MELQIKDFIGVKAKYDKGAQMIMGVDKYDSIQLIADVRGWGAIQNLFKNKDGTIDFEKAEDFQDKLGEWIADAVTKKLNELQTNT